MNQLPNPRLIRELYERYYQRDVLEEAPYRSSHWSYYSRQFTVGLDADGTVAALQGAAFGDLVGQHPLQRLLAYVGHLSYLAVLPTRRQVLALLPAARALCREAGWSVSFDVFKQVCVLATLQQHLTPRLRAKRLTFLMIGDGYGFLAALVKRVYPDATIVLVDLGKTLLFQSLYCQRLYPRCAHYGVMDATAAPVPDLARHDFVYCPTEHLEAVGDLRYDVAVAIASFQEMNLPTVARYFRFLRSALAEEHLFYCCSRASKRLRGGELIEFSAYPWDPRDHHLVDGPCPWYRYYLSWRTHGPGLRLLGLRIPFINTFDGVMLHRLSMLTPTTATVPLVTSAPGSTMP